MILTLLVSVSGQTFRERRVHDVSLSLNTCLAAPMPALNCAHFLRISHKPVAQARDFHASGVNFTHLPKNRSGSRQEAPSDCSR